MKPFACSILLAAAAVAAPAPVTRRGEIAKRAPIAEAFASTFPGFNGKSEQDVEKFITRGAQVTAQTSENAANWKRDAVEAGDEASYAITISKRSLHIKKQMFEDTAWIEKESERVDALARRAARLKREAADEQAASSLKREADAATEEVVEAYATLAYALQIKNAPQEIEFFTTRDQTAAEMAMGKERRVKRESFFVNKAARKREAIHGQALRLREEF